MLPEIKSILKEINLKDKEISVYEAILPLGSASVRELAQKTGINRGTVHDVLNSLVNKGLLFDEKKRDRKKFIVSSPEKIITKLEEQEIHLKKQKEKIQETLPSLMSFYSKQGGRPSVEYFDDNKGIKKILDDILNTLKNEKDDSQKKIYIYSSKSVREYLYKLFPNFTEEKIKHNIQTEVISLGGGGDPKNLKLAKRKTINQDSPSYIIIYGEKIAQISVAFDNTPFGVLINDKKITETQKIIFQQLWKFL